MEIREDLIGKRFGRLFVDGFARVDKGGNRRWRCICDCGNVLTVTSNHLASGHTKSCGCFRVETTSKQGKSRKGISVNFVHGHSAGCRGTSRGSRTYSAWKAMRERCLNPRSTRYVWYGARGITVCDRWSSFVNFLQDMGECPPGVTLERIDNDGNYEPGNCKWATMSEQRKNQRYLGRRVKEVPRARETVDVRSHSE